MMDGRRQYGAAVTHLLTVGIDVGATKVVAGVIAANGAVVDSIDPRLTPNSNSSSLVRVLLDDIDTLCGRYPEQIAAIGVGTAGLVSWPDGEIEFAANHGHRLLKLRRRLEERVDGKRVIVENDANAAAWAEASMGGHLGEGLLFLAVGTGLGSGFVMDGELMRGHGGRGAELGHVVVDHGPTARQCSCGQLGCLEVTASGRALALAGKEFVSTHPTSSLAKRLERAGGTTTKAIINAALANDRDAQRLVASMGERLGTAIGCNVMSLLPVDRVVVGGGLANLGDLLIEPVRSACRRAIGSSKCYRSPRVSRTVLGDNAILVGAGLLAHRTLMPEPAGTGRSLICPGSAVETGLEQVEMVCTQRPGTPERPAALLGALPDTVSHTRVETLGPAPTLRA